MPTIGSHFCGIILTLIGVLASMPLRFVSRILEQKFCPALLQARAFFPLPLGIKGSATQEAIGKI